jgi:hypothetical protein
MAIAWSLVQEASMRTQHVCGIVAAAFLTSAAAFAQTHPTTDNWEIGEVDDTPVTLIGCVQPEKDYREAHDSGDGRGGLGNEFILINASRVRAGLDLAQGEVDCGRHYMGDAYELTGRQEEEIEPLVGRLVQVSGIIKNAETEPTGTSGQIRPSGGFDPMGDDLRLFEVEVEGFSEVPARAARVEREPEPLAQVIVPYVLEEPVGTTGQVEPVPPRPVELPKTASPLPLAGVFTLLLIGGAWGVRLLRRD